jgi:hypothetical protein
MNKIDETSAGSAAPKNEAFLGPLSAGRIKKCFFLSCRRLAPYLAPRFVKIFTLRFAAILFSLLVIAHFGKPAILPFPINSCHWVKKYGHGRGHAY